MSLRLVNTDPGDVAGSVTPNQSFQAGMKTDDSLNVQVGTMRALLGFTRFHNIGVLPENDSQIEALSGSETLATTEHRTPISGSVSRSISAPGISISKTDNSDNNTCVYEIGVPIAPQAPVLGYFKFRTKTAWTLFNPDWCDLTNMTGMYFGLEHGSYNNAVYAFLRSTGGGHGSLVIGGPLQTYHSDRPGQTEISAFDWLALPNNTVVEIWLYYNPIGRPPPFSPSYVPVVEVWTKRGGVDSQPISQGFYPVDSFGSFPAPSSMQTNIRAGISSRAVLYFGNAGRTGDVLQLDDWAIFPDYRLTVFEGEALSNSSFNKVPDGPVSFNASVGKLMTESDPGLWIMGSDAFNQTPVEEMVLQPGSRGRPMYERITKSQTGIMVLRKKEPQLERKTHGAFLEAFISGHETAIQGSAFGAGLGIEDGTYAYQFVMLKNILTRSYGIPNSSGDVVDLSGYHAPLDTNGGLISTDYTSPKLLQLWVDRARSKVKLFVDGQSLITVNNLTDFPPAILGGRMTAGHLINLSSTGDLDIIFANYLHSFESYEAGDGDPTTGGHFTLNASGGGSTTTGLELTIAKTDYATSNSKRYYSTTMLQASSEGGFQLDFQGFVQTYRDDVGQNMAPLTWTGSGVKVKLGDKTLTLGFFDAGPNGRVVGVIPGSGDISDIINQTALGRKFSAPVDWTQSTFVRITYKAFKGIEIRLTTPVNDPVIVIPWRDDTEGFDLPLESTTPCFQFGHFDENTASTTVWDFFRFGVSNGFETSMSLTYPDGFPNYTFGGRFQSQLEFDEG